MSMQEDTTNLVPTNFERQRRVWHFGAMFMHGIYTTLAITFVVSSGIVAAFTEELGIFGTRLLAATSAISASLIEVTGVGRKGNEFRNAERKLRIAIIRFKGGDLNQKQLIDELEDAESLISDVKITIRHNETRTN